MLVNYESRTFWLISNSCGRRDSKIGDSGAEAFIAVLTEGNNVIGTVDLRGSDRFSEEMYKHVS